MTSLRSSIRSTSPAQCGRIRSGGRVAAISPREGVHPTVSFGGIVWISEMVIYFKGRKSSHIASHCITLLYNDGPLGEPPDEFTNKVVFCIQKLWGLICMICINLWHMIFFSRFFLHFFCASFVSMVLYHTFTQFQESIHFWCGQRWRKHHIELFPGGHWWEIMGFLGYSTDSTGSTGCLMIGCPWLDFKTFSHHGAWMLDLSNVQALVHHFVALSMGYPWIPSWSLVHRLLAVLIIFLPMNVAQVCSVLLRLGGTVFETPGLCLDFAPRICHWGMVYTTHYINA